LIFLSLGTHEAPFERAIDAIAPFAIDGSEVIVQHGSTSARVDLPQISWQQYMPYQQVITVMSRADTVVCHAGVGTIVTALQVGHLPIVIPRLRRFGEHVDDHQCDIAGRLAERGLVTCVALDETLKIHPTQSQAHHEGDFTAAGDGLRSAVAAAAESSSVRRWFHLKSSQQR
jgi:UDP-N-acetylglucosamine--N-acetylmuramyl-(pentapeptide) pyrophosphoryl-undecaprenol N-acetylglucosamine transferase